MPMAASHWYRFEVGNEKRRNKKRKEVTSRGKRKRKEEEKNPKTH
jgi:hypothetical protein